MKHTLTVNYADCAKCVLLLTQIDEDWTAGIAELLADLHTTNFGMDEEEEQLIE